MQTKVIAYIEFIIFLLSLVAFLIWPYRPWGTLKGVEESFFIAQLVGGLTLVIALIVYMGNKGGYIMKMNSDDAVHLLREKHAKMPFRRMVIILETGLLFLLYFELVSIIYLNSYGYEAAREIFASSPSGIYVKNEIIFRSLTIVGFEIAALLSYIVYLFYQRNNAYWTIYLANATYFKNDEEIMDALRAETHKKTLAYSIKMFFKILTFDSRQVRQYLIENADAEIDQENEHKARMKEIERIRLENIAKLEALAKADKDKWGD